MDKSILDSGAILDALAESLPPIFPRKQIPALTGGLLAAGTIANMGESGPPYMRLRRHAVYTRESFLAWFAVYLGRSEQ